MDRIDPRKVSLTKGNFAESRLAVGRLSTVLIIALTCLGIFLNPKFLIGDAIVITRAASATTVVEVFVDRQELRVELEIGKEDLAGFNDLLSAELLTKFPEPDSSATLTVDNFSGFAILADGRPLERNVTHAEVRNRITRDEVTGEPLGDQSMQGELVAYLTLEFPFAGLPEKIEIRPPASGQDNRVLSEIGFTTYHLGLPVMDFRYLAQPETLTLDWEDPWYSRFENRNLKRHFDAPLSVFLYVEPFETRVEVVLRPIDAQRWIDLRLDESGQIPISRQDEIRTTVASYLREHFKLRIDGQSKEVTLDRSHFLNRTLRQTGIVDPPQDLPSLSATLGLIWICPTETLPDRVELDWGVFDDRIALIRGVATDEAGGLPQDLTAEHPTLVWQNYLTNPTIPAMKSVPAPPARPILQMPLISLILAFAGLTLGSIARFARGHIHRHPVLNWLAAGLLIASVATGSFRTAVQHPLKKQARISANEATEVTDSLIHNIYRSFDRRDRSLIYDRLAESASGELLRDLFLQINERLKVEQLGGAQVKIDQVQLVSARPSWQDDSPGFDCDVVWNVIGTVGHWGHLHQRTNQYHAAIQVQPVESGWLLTDLVMLGESEQSTLPLGTAN